MRLRPAVAEDAPALGEIVDAGFETYRAFGPPGWEPPRQGALMAAELARPELRCIVAEADDGIVTGLVAVVPAPASRHGGPADLLHLMALFVAEPWWGTGVARALLVRVLAEAAAGYRAVRLYCATGQARARRFYEREGFTVVGEPFDDPSLGLEIVEYRRPPA